MKICTNSRKNWNPNTPMSFLISSPFLVYRVVLMVSSIRNQQHVASMNGISTYLSISVYSGNDIGFTPF